MTDPSPVPGPRGFRRAASRSVSRARQRCDRWGASALRLAVSGRGRRTSGFRPGLALAGGWRQPRASAPRVFRARRWFPGRMCLGHRPGQQFSPGRGERGHQRLEQSLQCDVWVALAGEERAVEGGEREAGELVGDGAVWVVAERDRDLGPQQLKRMRSHAPDDGLDLAAARGRRLGGEADQQAQEAGVTFGRADGARDEPGQVGWPLVLSDREPGSRPRGSGSRSVIRLDCRRRLRRRAAVARSMPAAA